jgi:two-component system chemotaxis response regulator CheY
MLKWRHLFYLVGGSKFRFYLHGKSDMPKIMIVDDSSVSRLMIKGRIVGLQPGWEILEAASGDAALKLVTADSPDFITMDVNMPGMNGFEAVEKIREINKTVRIALLTANIQESSREKASALGIQFVQKPATLAAVQQAIDYFLAAP